MNSVNFLTACAFACALLLGLMFIVMQDMRNKRPEGRIRTRMAHAFAEGNAVSLDASPSEEALFTMRKEHGSFSRWLEPKMTRLRTVAGTKGIRIVAGATLLAAGVALAMVYFMPLPNWSKPLLLVGVPVWTLRAAYRFLVNRFRNRFLQGFPEIIDTIVRAVRAGVPVIQVFKSAGDDASEPLKSEFALMSDSLEVGRDLDEVLATAMRRIEIADFSFFCVCLLLQRETGGQLGETLENLSGIVRTRKEVRQKSKALTAEARITTKILAAIPFVITLGMYATNRPYIMVLFNRQEGHKLLTFAAISVVLGIIVISKMSKLDTSR
ncbi:MAG: type II secretion system F family protein [Janthinobacterium lividum]